MGGVDTGGGGGGGGDLAAAGGCCFALDVLAGSLFL